MNKQNLTFEKKKNKYNTKEKKLDHKFAFWIL